MFAVCAHVASLLALAIIVVAEGPTSIFIDKVPQYALLAECAEGEVSTIVRGMEYGCGGFPTYESFACFCLQSSARFSNMIGTRVASRCSQDPSQNTTALQVFSSYCAIGQSRLANPDSFTTFTSSTPTQAPSATPEQTPTSPSATATTAASAQTPPPRKKTHTTAIAAGVTIPAVAIIASAISFFFLYRRRQNKKNSPPVYEANATESDKAYYAGQATTHEISDKHPAAKELPGPDPIIPAAELDGADVKEERRQH